MELMYNELSVDALSANRYAANDKMKLFSETVAEARRRGFRNIRSHHDSHQIQLTADYTLYDWLNNGDVSKELRDNMYGMLILPFIRDEDEQVVAGYVSADYYFEDAANGIAKTSCPGLAAAHLYETLSVSLQSSAAWIKNELEVRVEVNGTSTSKQVNNVFSRGCFDVATISGIVENLGNVVLDESPLAPDAKDIHLADHHGKKELKALWNRLKNNPYVIAGRSTDFGGKRFIRKTSSDGVVEIVLVDSDKEYALWVQTTGRNLRETKAIAEILKDRYE